MVILTKGTCDYMPSILTQVTCDYMPSLFRGQAKKALQSYLSNNGERSPDPDANGNVEVTRDMNHRHYWLLLSRYCTPLAIHSVAHSESTTGTTGTTGSSSLGHSVVHAESCPKSNTLLWPLQVAVEEEEEVPHGRRATRGSVAQYKHAVK